MSFIAAAAAKDRINNYFGKHSFDAFGSVGAGMTADAANYITDTKEEAKRDYISTMGAVNVKGQKQVGGAMQNMSNGQFMGSLLETGGQLLGGISQYGQNNWGWGKKP